MNTKTGLVIFFLGLSLALAVFCLPAARPETALAAPSACVPGPHGGNITFDQTWCKIDSPHYVSFSIHVNAGVTLTIEPGVIVYINDTPAMTVFVDGTLNAVGTSDQPITITSSAGGPAPGDWGGIDYASGSHGILAYTDISYGGAGAGSSIGLHIQSSDVQVLHTRIHHIMNWPVIIRGTGLSPVFEDVEIDHNQDLYPIQQTTITQHPSYTNVRLHDNGVDALWISPSSVEQDVTLDGSPTALNGAPIYYEGGNVNAGKTLTITPGTTIKFGGNRSLNVVGSLMADGTPTLPITFTSQAALPQPGNWGGIGFKSGSHGRLAYCEIAYGGGAGSAGVALSIETSDVQVLHTRIHHIMNWPVVIQGTGLSPVFEDVEIDHNQDLYPIRQTTITQHPSYINVRLHDNGTNALWIPPSSVEQDVTLDGSPAALNGAPIYFDGGTVNAGKTLTVTPGTTIKFGGNRSLVVKGGLAAVGTAILPISFTSQSAAPQPGDWGAISLESGSSGRLAYCEIAYAGGPGGSNRGLNVSTSDVQVRHSRIHHIFGIALDINGVGSAPIFEDVEIDHNPGNTALRQSTITQQPSYTNIRLHDNGTNALWIPQSNVTANVTLNGSPAALNGAAIYYDGGSVNAGSTLTITPGTTIQIINGRPLQVYGGLTAEGTPALPIRFTSRAAIPQPGDWGPLAFNNGSHGSLAFCEIAYGGYSGGGGSGLYINTPDVQVRACRIHHTNQNALYINNNIQIAMQNLVFADNPGTAVRILPGGQLTGKHFTLARNGTAVYVSGAGSLALTNTILSRNTLGLSVGGGGTATLAQTLWDGNTLNVTGSVNETGHIDGEANFAQDGYHLGLYSTALEQGVDAGVTSDIDGEARPLPAGSAPDLGADELNVWHYFHPWMRK